MPRTEIVYVAGRLFIDHAGKWVYESYNHCFTSDRLPNLPEALGDIYRRSEEEAKFQVDSIQRAKDKILANEEERKQAAKAAASKKKSKSGAKKDQKEEEEEKKDDKLLEVVKKELDPFLPAEFAQLL